MSTTRIIITTIILAAFLSGCGTRFEGTKACKQQYPTSFAAEAPSTFLGPVGHLIASADPDSAQSKRDKLVEDCVAERMSASRGERP